jgi:hypothetical protein
VRLQVAARNEGSQQFWRTVGYEVLEEVLERPALPTRPREAHA